MKGMRIALAIIGFAMLTAPSAIAQRGLGRISGVLTSDEGKPVSGAVVKLEMPDGTALEGKTDGTGKWSITGMRSGDFQLEIAKDGFATKRLKIVVAKETFRSEPIKLSPKKA